MAHRALLLGATLLLAACAGPDPQRMSPLEARALIEAKLPPALADRAGWAHDIHSALAALRIEPGAERVCAIVAVTEQETGFEVDPVVPGLAQAAWKEIEGQRARAGIPALALQAALALESGDGRSYRARIDAVKTERELSDVFDDLVGRVPLGRVFLADRNPVRTGGPMQVGIAYAQAHAADHGYPYPVPRSLRDEVFTRRGGMYFGIAHLLDYPASYDAWRYRFADFNAGHYASRNAAFQRALATLSGRTLALDGDLLVYDGGEPAAAPGQTERAAQAIAARLEMAPEQIRRDLELGKRHEFERSRLWQRVFALADAGARAPRAVIPRIDLKSAKFTRKLTTEWFATRVEGRYRRCLARAPLSGKPASGSPAPARR